MSIWYDILSTAGIVLPATFADGRRSLQANTDFLNRVREMKREYRLKVYAMSNISQYDFQQLQTGREGVFSLFDRCFASGDIGLRKPDAAFYEYVIQQI
ncbi:hypothetical protein ASPZODRAFT_137369 [Penicilliopsis zonata CBS 506.65]|uniref:Uncharacterized protein n=1 Tax=Penicilliopsis zonata CBS 506.65 TaxID=1073090 RepID=A0A1L9S544_9EURO|nr:hypothetical protein ASPZODRAFT_137369 [Penicilliopsis zonata CBS 506.65]OJJ42280.1 hypothetical protein ASPZODRAFT_137369 [Penicilliopsis zonata CBS 506.65]